MERQSHNCFQETEKPMSYLPQAVAPKRSITHQRRIDELNARLLREYRVILACATHCDSVRLMGLPSATAQVDPHARAMLNNAQNIVTSIESLGGTPAYQVRDFGI